MKKTGSGPSPDRVRLFIKYLLMTKLAILCILVFSIQSFGRGYGQGNINLRLEKTQLKKVFKAIEDQGFFRFVYKDEILPREQRVTIVARQASVEEVLAKILERTGLSYHRLTENLIVIVRTAGPDAVVEKPLAAVKVGGRVTNEKGEPLKDVTVLEKGTNNGTMTKEDGSYTLDVTNPNATLVFSFVGYAPQEFAIKGKTLIDV